MFADPLSTAVVEKGLTSRGLSVEKVRGGGYKYKYIILIIDNNINLGEEAR